MNRLSNKERPTFVLKAIMQRMEVAKGFIAAGQKAYAKFGCPPRPYTDCGDPAIFKAEGVTYKLQLKFQKGK